MTTVIETCSHFSQFTPFLFFRLVAHNFPENKAKVSVTKNKIKIIIELLFHLEYFINLQLYKNREK